MKNAVMENVKEHMKEYKNAKLYLHTMKKVLSEGKDFLRKERCRRLKMRHEMGVFAKK